MTTDNNPPQPTLGGDGRYCVHHDDDPAHTKECYEPELAPQPADVAGVPELKPCPFGCFASKMGVYQLPDSLSRHVYCTTCNASGPWGDSDEEAYRLWNACAPANHSLDLAYADGYANGFRHGKQSRQPRATQAATTPGDTRMFPIQRAEPVPWKLAEIAYATYAGRYGKDQSLERLAERGGFGWHEFLHLFYGDGKFRLSDEEVAERWRKEVLSMAFTTPPDVAERARRAARQWMNTHHASFETNQKREEALAEIIAAEFGRGE